MDVEKLIRRLRNDADAYRNGETLGRAFADQEDVLDNAATALSTLQAENEKLRADVVRLNDLLASYQNVLVPELRTELEQVKRERDAAMKDMEALMWFSGEGCHICAHEIIIHKEPYVRSECALGNCAACCPTWRGPQKEN